MKILHVIGSMNPTTGGPCQGIRNSNIVLEKLGIYREVISLDDPSSSFLGIDTFPVHALGPGKTAWRYTEKLIPWLKRNLHRFDVIIINGLWLYHCYAVTKLLQKLKQEHKITPKCFVMPHGMLDPYFQEATARKLKAIRNWFYWKLVERKTVNDADGILFTCGAELLLARKPFKPYYPKKELNIGYGVPQLSHFTPSMKEAFNIKCTQLQKRPYLLFLSRIHDKKGVDILIRAYEQIISLYPDFPCLVIAGPGLDTKFGLHIQQIVKQAKLSDLILFPGMLTGDAKYGALYGCEVFILPSHQENFGIAVAEALACGKPVLISNQVNIWQEIKDAGAGLVENDTIEGTIALLKNWHELTAQDKTEMKAKAKECFQKNFNIERTTRNFLAAIMNE